MRAPVDYEWDVETYDAHGDIVDHMHYAELADIAAPLVSGQRLVLVRTGQFRDWAYATADGALPSKFADCFGLDSGYYVPKRFRLEFLSHGARLLGL